MSYPMDLEEKIEDELINKYGLEWSFMMGSSHAIASDKIPYSPRRVYWASMTTYVMYSGPEQFKRHANLKEGYLKIISAEKHYSFNEAINDLIVKMREFVQ